MKTQAATRLCAAALVTALLSACATPTVVSTRRVGDESLSCEGLRREFADAEDFEQKARAERKVTGKNVAAVLFFWPALLGTYSNTEEAISAAKDRQRNLVRIAESKKCNI